MSEREDLDTDLTSYSLDDEDQLQPEDTLDGDGDVLDRGYRVEEHYRGVTAHGVTAEEQSHEETIDQRLRQEEPDPWSRAEDDTGTVDDGFVGADDPEEVRRALGRDDEGHHRVGRIIDPGEGDDHDHHSHLLAREGRATSWDAPEESAMHYVDGDEEDAELLEEEWLPSDEVRPGEDE